MTAAIISLAVVAMLNVALVAFGYGRLTQKVLGLSKTVNGALNNHLAHIDKKLDEIAERVARIEGRLD